MGDRPQQVADEVARRLVARDEEEHELRARLDVGEAAAVDLALQQPGDEVVARVVAPGCDQRRRRSSRTRGARPAGRRRARCGWSRATCPAPLRRTRRPRGGSPRVARRGGARSRCWAPASRTRCTRSTGPSRSQQVVEQVVAQLLAERFDVHEAVHRDRGVDDAAHLAVARLGDLVDELLLVGHDDAGLAEARLEQLDVLGGREHVVVPGEVPRPGGRARDGAAGAELLEPGGVAGRAQRIEASSSAHPCTIRETGSMTTPLLGLRTVIHPVADLGRRQGSGSPICSGSGPTSTSRSTSASRWPATSSGCCPTPTRPTARSCTGASTTSRPRSPTRWPVVRRCTPRRPRSATGSSPRPSPHPRAAIVGFIFNPHFGGS